MNPSPRRRPLTQPRHRVSGLIKCDTEQPTRWTLIQQRVHWNSLSSPVSAAHLSIVPGPLWQDDGLRISKRVWLWLPNPIISSCGWLRVGNHVRPWVHVASNLFGLNPKHCTAGIPPLQSNPESVRPKSPGLICGDKARDGTLTGWQWDDRGNTTVIWLSNAQRVLLT